MARFSQSFLEESLMLQQRIAYDGSGNAEYMGYADPGVKEDDEQWLIVKWQYNSSSNATAKTFAGSSKAFDKSWTDRAGYTYA